MKVSFPYMGPVILYKKVLEKFGHEVVMPLTPNKETFDLGVKNSPEYACFPFKVMLGTYIQTCQKGVDIIATTGGMGPCRAGYFGEIHKRILWDMGYDVDFIIFDTLSRGKIELLKKLLFLKNKKSIFKAIPIAIFCYKLLKALDHFERLVTKIRPYEVNKGESDAVWETIKKDLTACESSKELKDAYDKSVEKMNKVKTYDVPKSDRVKIGVVGEIYVVLEPSVNAGIEKKLNALGCETQRSIYLLDWVNYNLFRFKKENEKEKEVIQKGAKYIKTRIGGHAQETVGSIVEFYEHNYDGIIHLMPFSCLPELVSQSVISTLSEKMPIMTLSLDEQTGEANNQTRIEAFVDLLKRKKRRETG
ncbi:MAG: hypothetical protein ACLFQE_06730 [Thermotogota bacterium]